MTENARALPAVPETAVNLTLAVSPVVASLAPCLHPAAIPAPPPPTVPTPRPRRKAAWLALHFEAWPLTAVLSGMTPEQREQLRSRPFAVLDLDRKRRVLVCNERARALGVRTGHSMNAAIALCSELEVVSRDLQREAALLEATARDCQRYTSTVSLEPPNQLLLEVRGSFRLFGGVQGLVKAVCDDFAARGVAVNVVLAPTARSASWLSRAAGPARIVPPQALPAALMRLPLDLLGWPPQITQRLLRFGVTTLADLRRLPRGGLARRIGAQYLLELDAAFGRQSELRHAIMELPRYRDRVVLDAEIETTGLLELLIAVRLRLLEQFLITRTLALSELVLELVHRAPPLTMVRIGLALPTLDMSHLQMLIRERLSALQLPAPIIELRLHAAHLVVATCCARQLFHSSGEAEGLPQRLVRLVETLESRLGKQALRALRVVADHRPERAQARTCVTVGAIASMTTRHAQAGCQLPESLPPRPLWLLGEPVPLRVQDCVILSGPESIESGWWDDRPCRREYFIAQARSNQVRSSHVQSGQVRSNQGRHDALWWIFREPGHGPEQWFLHGLFG
jgi:protein ImuB